MAKEPEQIRSDLFYPLELQQKAAKRYQELGRTGNIQDVIQLAADSGMNPNEAVSINEQKIVVGWQRTISQHTVVLDIGQLVRFDTDRKFIEVAVYNEYVTKEYPGSQVTQVITAGEQFANNLKFELEKID